MAQPQGTVTLVTDLGGEDGALDTFTFVNPAQINQAWGSVSSQIGQTGDMGEHSSEAGTFTPDAGDGGRAGVGNVSTSDEDFVPVGDADGEVSLADGANGLHSTYNGALLGSEEIEEIAPGSLEAEMDPIVPELYGSISLDVELIV
jgi:hypothetical protein